MTPEPKPPEPKIVDVTLVYADDWAGVYADGLLVYQDRRVDADRLARLMNGTVFRISKVIGITRSGLDGVGAFHAALSDVVAASETRYPQ